MKEKINKIINIIKSSSSKTYKKIKSLLSSGKTKIKKMVEKIVDKSKNLINKIVDKSKKLKNKINKNLKQKIKNTKNKSKKESKINKKTIKTTKRKNKDNQKEIKNNKTKKLDYKSFSVKEIESELNRTKYNEKYLKILRSTIYSLIIIASIAIIIATLIMPVFEINSTSMSGTYEQGDVVASLKTNKIKQGDIIAFYHGNKILVKRVIATSGSWIVIDDSGNIYVNGELLKEPYVENKTPGEYDIEFPYQVPDGSYFVLSDQREDTIDSRNSQIGSIQKENIIGKILFRIWPLSK